jgi:hypothetical protein
MGIRNKRCRCCCGFANFLKQWLTPWAFTVTLTRAEKRHGDVDVFHGRVFLVGSVAIFAIFAFIGIIIGGFFVGRDIGLARPNLFQHAES